MSLQDAFQEKEKVQIREPKYYHVIMYNDDFTTMDFVVTMLIEVFHKEEPEAVRLMYIVHRSGRAVIGTYSYDIACTKAKTAMAMARSEGFPFRLSVEEVTA